MVKSLQSSIKLMFSCVGKINRYGKQLALAKKIESRESDEEASF